jgi:hypothetical protein
MKAGGDFSHVMTLMVCAHSSLLNVYHVFGLVEHSPIDKCGIMLSLSIYPSNCSHTRITPSKRTVDVAITWLLRCKQHLWCRRSSSHRLARNAAYSSER